MVGAPFRVAAVSLLYAGVCCHQQKTGAASEDLFTQVPRETVWKLAEGFSTVRSWGQEAADRVLFTPLGGLRRLHSRLIPIFQTVSEEAFSEVRIQDPA